MLAEGGWTAPPAPAAGAPVGVVLAGGASRRFGLDKAVLELAGERLVDRALRRLTSVCDEVVVADGGRRLCTGAASIVDGAGQGPAAGILGAAAYRRGRALLILACDLPLVPASLLATLGRRPEAWVVPRWAGGIEPLCALYRPPALALLEQAVVGRGELALHRLLEADGLEVGFLEGESLCDHGEPAELFLNLNRPRDLALLEGLG